MLKLLLFAIGVAGGAAGAISWLLSAPDGAAVDRAVSSLPDAARERVQFVQGRFNAALEEGKRAGAETEQALNRELDTQRRQPARSAASA